MEEATPTAITPVILSSVLMNYVAFLEYFKEITLAGYPLTGKIFAKFLEKQVELLAQHNVRDADKWKLESYTNMLYAEPNMDFPADPPDNANMATMEKWKQKFRTANGNRTKALSELHGIYSTILTSLISEESRTLITGHAKFEEVVRDERNPFGLFLIMEETHMSSQIIMKTRQELNNLRSSSMSSYAEYAKVFRANVKILKRRVGGWTDHELSEFVIRGSDTLHTEAIWKKYMEGAHAGGYPTYEKLLDEFSTYLQNLSQTTGKLHDSREANFSKAKKPAPKGNAKAGTAPSASAATGCELCGPKANHATFRCNKIKAMIIAAKAEKATGSTTTAAPKAPPAAIAASSSDNSTARQGGKNRTKNRNASEKSTDKSNDSGDAAFVAELAKLFQGHTATITDCKAHAEANLSTKQTDDNAVALDCAANTGVSRAVGPSTVGAKDISKHKIGLSGINSNADELLATHAAKLRHANGTKLGSTLVIPDAKRELAALVCILRENPGAYFDGDIEVFNIWASPQKEKLLLSVNRNPANDLYEFKLDGSQPTANSALASDTPINADHLTPEEKKRATAVRVFHRIWHISDTKFKQALNGSAWKNVEFTSSDIDNSNLLFGRCVACDEAKSVAAPHRGDSKHHRERPDPKSIKLHGDIVYLFESPTLGGNTCSLLVVDDKTGKPSIVHLKTKTAKELYLAIDKIAASYELYRWTPYGLQTDSEIVFKSLKTELAKRQPNGLEHTTTAPGLHERRVERTDRTVLEHGKAILNGLSYEPPPKIHGELITHVVKQLGKTPNSMSGGKTPDEIITGVKPTVLGLPWGTPVSCFNWATTGSSGKTPLKQSRAEIGIIVGQSESSDTRYRVYIPGHKEGVIERDKVDIKVLDFIPKEWGWPARTALKTTATLKSAERSLLGEQTPDTMVPTGPTLEPATSTAGEKSMEKGDYAAPNSSQKGEIPSTPNLQIAPTSGSTQVSDAVSTPITATPAPTASDRSKTKATTPPRTPKKSVPIETVTPRKVTFSPVAPVAEPTPVAAPTPVAPVTVPPLPSAPAPSATTRTRSGRVVKNRDYNVFSKKGMLAYTKLKSGHLGPLEQFMSDYIANYTDNKRMTLGKYVKEKDHDRGITAAESEIRNIKENGTGELLFYKDLTKQQKDNVRRGFMFLLDKFKSSGAFDKTKARYVYNGKEQPEGTITETSAQTINPVTLFILFGITAYEDYEADCVDVVAAFLKALLQLPPGEDIIIEFDVATSKVWVNLYPDDAKYLHHGRLYLRLIKSLYGIKQAPHDWWIMLSKFLVKLGYKQCPYDQCLYSKRDDEGNVLYVPTHVDDMYVTGTRGDNPLRTELYEAMRQEFGKITVEPATSFLGFSLRQDRKERAMYVDMNAQVQAIFQKHPELQNLRSRLNPCDADFYKRDEDAKPVNRKKYLSLLMSIYYPARFVIPQLLPTLSYLAQYGQEPTTSEMSRLLKVYGYVLNKDFTIRICPNGMQVGASMDAAYAVHPDGRSHSATVLTVGTAPVGYVSRKIKTIANSSTAAEGYTLGDGIPLVVWTRDLVKWLGYPQNGPAAVSQDNTAVIQMSTKHDSLFNRSKHMLIKFLFIRDHVDRKVITLRYVRTTELTADLLTKALYGPNFRRNLRALTGYEPVQ